MSILDPTEIVNTITTVISKNSIQISASATKLTLGMMLKIFSTGVEQLKKIPAVPGNPTHGQKSIKRLQHENNGDLHNQVVEKKLLKDLKHDFRARGIDFAIEKGKDGQTYLHFKGGDVDSIKHGFLQAKARLEKRINRKETRQDIKTALENRVAEKIRKQKEKTRTIKRKEQNLNQNIDLPADKTQKL